MRCRLGLLGEIFGGGFTRVKLQRMFDYRHRVVLEHFRGETSLDLESGQNDA
jgi:ligand-binding SRPBCC domain-containing protein